MKLKTTAKLKLPQILTKIFCTAALLLPMISQTTTKPIRELTVDALTVKIYESSDDVALAASELAHCILQQVLSLRSEARVVFATGRSQKQCLHHFTNHTASEPFWSSMIGFHLDEYLGIAADHPASFRQYLRSHLTEKVRLKRFYEIEGDALLPMTVCEAYEEALRSRALDLCFLGIGENGHLAFNDPGVADFSDSRWVKLVRLDHRNRIQQAKSTAFDRLESVPQYAFTLTLSAINAIGANLCLAFGEGKAAIVSQLLNGLISPTCPASILRRVQGSVLLLDQAAASKLAKR